MPAVFANQVLVKVMPAADGTVENVAVLFGLVEAPNFSGPVEDQAAQMAAVTSIPIEVVAKIIVGPGRLREMAKALEQLAGSLEKA